jgi:hypothetical protein
MRLLFLITIREVHVLNLDLQTHYSERDLFCCFTQFRLENRYSVTDIINICGMGERQFLVNGF